MATNMALKPNFKLNLVMDCVEGKMKLSEAAKKAGVTISTIDRWINRYKSEGKDAFFASNIRTYPMEVKLNAVRDVVIHKKSYRQTCMTYKIRSETTLRDWIALYAEKIKSEAKSKEPAKGSVRDTAKVSPQERKKIAKECFNAGKNYAEIASKYNVAYQQVRIWTLRYEQLGDAGFKDPPTRLGINEKHRIETKLKTDKLMQELSNGLPNLAHEEKPQPKLQEAPAIPQEAEIPARQEKEPTPPAKVPEPKLPDPPQETFSTIKQLRLENEDLKRKLHIAEVERDLLLNAAYLVNYIENSNFDASPAKEKSLEEKLREVERLEPIAKKLYDQELARGGMRMTFRKFFAQKLGESESGLQRLLVLRRLSPNAKLAVNQGKLSETAASYLATLPYSQQEEYALQLLFKDKFNAENEIGSVKHVQQYVQTERRKLYDPFEDEDSTEPNVFDKLVPEKRYASIDDVLNRNIF